jgi:hypothetical protein
MIFIYIRHDGDTQTLTENVKRFEAHSNEDFISAYNRQAKCGIIGVHGQALLLMAMGHVFLKRFGKSPISLEENVLDIRGEIKLVGETFEYIE